MKQKLLQITFFIFLGFGVSFAQTNVAAGKTVTIIPTKENPDYLFHPGTSADGITDGIKDENGSTRWLYDHKTNEISVNDPISFEVDFGTDFIIDSYELTEMQDVSAYTFETWNGSGWDIQATVAAIKDATGDAAVTTGSFTAVTTSKVRVVITENLDDNGGSGTRAFIRVHELEVYASATASINDYTLNKVSVHPNPVLGNELTIDSQQKINSLKIYNILGKQMKSSFTGKKIDISNLNSGIYIIRVNNGNAIKFIKQ